jgi:hypothetical protein
MPARDAKVPEATSGSPDKLQGHDDVRPRRRAPPKCRVRRGLEGLARLLGRAAAAEATGSRLTGVAPDRDRE